jgi:hypothetical protein
VPSVGALGNLLCRGIESERNVTGLPANVGFSETAPLPFAFTLSVVCIGKDTQRNIWSAVTSLFHIRILTEPGSDCKDLQKDAHSPLYGNDSECIAQLVCVADNRN